MVRNRPSDVTATSAPDHPRQRKGITRLVNADDPHDLRSRDVQGKLQLELLQLDSETQMI